MDYKGIYYGETKEQKFFEGGAHFKYSDLYRKLELLVRENQKENKIEMRNKSNENNNSRQLVSYYIDEKPVKNIIHTRNINKNYLNYPNTQITNFNRTMSNMEYYKKKSESLNHEKNNNNANSYKNMNFNNQKF